MSAPTTFETSALCGGCKGTGFSYGVPVLRAESLAPPKVTAFVIGDAVKIHMDGRVDVNPDCELNEAAKKFWDVVRQHMAVDEADLIARAIRKAEGTGLAWYISKGRDRVGEPLYAAGLSRVKDDGVAEEEFCGSGEGETLSIALEVAIADMRSALS